MNNSIEDFAKSTKNICLCSTLSIFLILVFIISPINKILMLSLIGKIGIIVLLMITIFLMINNTYGFTQNNDISFLEGNWSQLKSNIVCNYIFSIFLLVLLLFVIKKIFR